jgi:DNA polymerase III gamma/tau subunit
LRHLLLVQHMGHVPESLPVTEETKELLRQQANQLPEPTVLRLIDLLALAVEDMRQGGDPRLPLELALVKVTRPHADLSRESLAHRVELLETRAHALGPHVPAVKVEQPGEGGAVAVASEPAPEAPAPEPPPSSPLALEQVSEAWQRTIVEAVRDRSISTASLLTDAKPIGLDDDTLTVEFPPGNDFHRKQLEEPKNIGLLHEALYEVTGRRLTVVLEAGHAETETELEDDEPQSEEDWIESLKQTFDAREVDETE